MAQRRARRRGNQSQESIQGSPPAQPSGNAAQSGRGKSSQRSDGEGQKQQNRRERPATPQGADVQQQQERRADQSEESIQRSTPTQSPGDLDRQSTREKSQRGAGEGEKPAATHQESGGEPKGQRSEVGRNIQSSSGKCAAASTRMRRTRVIRRKAPAAERRESNVQQQPQRPQEKTQGGIRPLEKPTATIAA